MLQTIAIIIILLVGLILLAASMMEKEYSLSSSIIINRPQNVVFDYVKHLKNQERYSKWVMADPKVKLTYTGTDGNVGFRAAWESADKNVGVGEQEIMSIQEGIGYDAEIRFEKPFKGISTANVTTEAMSSNQTKVTTTFNSKTPFPMNIMVPMIKKMLQKDMDMNSENLKRVLENQ